MRATKKIMNALSDRIETGGGPARLIVVSRMLGVMLKKEGGTAWPKGKAYFAGIRIVRSEDVTADEIEIF